MRGMSCSSRERSRSCASSLVSASAPAFSALTDQSADEYFPQGPVEVPRVALLMGLLAHNAEMYGISSVYLRARNIVPPASEGR